MITTVGLGNQLIDLAVGDLSKDAVAFSDGQEDGIEHFVDAPHDAGIGAGKLLRLATLTELAFMGGVGEPHHFLLQVLQHDSHVVDGDLHLLVVAFVGLRNQLIDLAIGDLRKDAVAFADREEGWHRAFR